MSFCNQHRMKEKTFNCCTTPVLTMWSTTRTLCSRASAWSRAAVGWRRRYILFWIKNKLFYLHIQKGKLRKNDLTDRGLWYRVAFTYSYKWTLSPWVCCCYFYHYNDNVEGWLVYRNIMSLLPTFWLSSALVIKIDSSGQISQSNVNKTYWSFFNEGRFTKELGWKWWIGFPLSSTCRSSL